MPSNMKNAIKIEGGLKCENRLRESVAKNASNTEGITPKVKTENLPPLKTVFHGPGLRPIVAY